MKKLLIKFAIFILNKYRKINTCDHEMELIFQDSFNKVYRYKNVGIVSIIIYSEEQNKRRY